MSIIAQIAYSKKGQGMSREILFKLVFQHETSKEVREKEYTLDELMKGDIDDILYFECDCEPTGETNVVECNCEEYLDGFLLIAKLQFTGRKVKDTIELCEDDIVKDNVGRIWVVEYDRRNMAFLFSWAKDRPQKQPYSRFILAQRPLKRIGNIHENPELMEKK